MNLFSLTAKLTLDDNNYASKLDKAEDSMDELGRTTERTSKKQTTFGDSLKKLDAPLSKMSTGILGIATALGANAIATQDHNSKMTALETSYLNMGVGVGNAHNIMEDFYGVLGDTDRSIEASQQLVNLTTNTQEMSKWGVIASGVYAQFGDSLPLEGLVEASNETAKVGEVTGALADALNWAGINEETFNEQLAGLSTEQERASLITETLNGQYATLGQEYQKNNEGVIANRDSTLELKENMAQLGEVITPIITWITELANNLIPLFTQMITENGTEIAFLAGTILVATGLVKGMMIINSIVGAVKAWTLATQGMTLAQKLMNLVMLANPMALLLVGITALAGGLLYLWTTSETFRNAVVSIFNGIVSFFKGTVEFYFNYFSGVFTGIFTTIEETITNVIGNVKGIFQGIIDFVTGVFTGNWKGAWNGLVSIFTNIVGGIGNIFKAPLNIIIRGINSFIRGLNKIKIPDWVKR